MNFERQLAFTGKEEGLRLKTYKCPAGHNTIGYGHNLDANGLPKTIMEILFDEGIEVIPGKWDALIITPRIADRLFEIDVKIAESDARRIFPMFDTFSESRQTAIIDMIFNMGVDSFAGKKGFKNMINAAKLGLWKIVAAEAKDSEWYRKLTYEYKSKRAERVIKMFSE